MAGAERDAAYVHRLEQALRFQLGCIGHWEDDIRCNLRPTEGTLSLAREAILVALRPEETRDRAPYPMAAE